VAADKDTDRFAYLLIHSRYRLAHDVVKYAFYAYAAWSSVQIAEALAGKATLVNGVLVAILSRDSDFGIPWFVALTFTAWAFLERTLRRRKTEQMQGHIKDLELRIDSGRTTSGLLPNGTHRKSEEL